MGDRADLLVICGPTATGKTALAVRLAQLLNGEIVSADSMQIYKGLRIGTAQPDEKEMQDIPHHLVGFLSPEESFSVADYVRIAGGCIANITARGRVPILVGGTGLYIESLVNGIDFTDLKTDPTVRQRLQAELESGGIEPLYARLRKIDPPYAAKLHPASHGRVLRALEWYEQTGETMTHRLARSVPKQRPYRPLLIGLTFSDRARLYARTDARVDDMLHNGLLKEARAVFEHRGTYKTAAQAIGYKEFFPFFEGSEELDACIAALKRATRRYAKRQLTWFRHMDEIVWREAGDGALAQMIVSAWQKQTGAGRGKGQG